ncbi:MAG: hypothetical protein NVSMB68_12780 [Thermoanaerobaculia bacterium]
MRLERLFSYDDWANREEVAHLRRHGASTPAVRLLAHIIAAQWLWLERLGSAHVKMSVWPELTLDQCSSHLDGLRDAWGGTLRDADRDAIIDYRNSKGERWSTPVDDVLMHVVMHGTYHRGQIATLVRQGGQTPAYTDFVHAARSNLI